MRIFLPTLVLAGLPSMLMNAQSLGSAGTIEGTVKDQTGAAIPGATVEVRNAISGYRRTLKTADDGVFRFSNVPPNPYHLHVEARGFSPVQQDVITRGGVPVQVPIQMTVASAQTTVVVESHSADLLESAPYAHVDVDSALHSKLPISSPGSALSDAITLASPGVVADSNGFFHPLGDHAQTSFSIDGQPVNDQQSKAFSTQMPLNAIQSMELITGAPNAEFGDKTSLVVNAVTRSGLGQKPTGSLMAQYGSFGTVAEEGALGFGGPKVGNFLVVNALRSGRFLDTPEFRPVHAIGNSGTIFDRFDWQPSSKDVFHLNLMAARNWFQTPNTYDQPTQDQRQKVLTFNIAPGYQHTFGPRTLFTVNGFVRQDRLNYYPSPNLEDDAPATLGQQRHLTNYGFKTDVSHVEGAHNIKVGIQAMQTRLREAFSLGITDPAFNAVCVDGDGGPQGLPGVTDPAACQAAGFVPNPNLQPGLVPYDLTRGGQPFAFRGNANINQFAFYAQDSITMGRVSINAGIRAEHYGGLSSANAGGLRLGGSYLLEETGTVLRASFAHTLETPYNENLILSSSTGSGGLAQNIFGAFGVEPLKPGRRNQFNTGLQQAIGRYLLVDADYFWKFTDNAFDFGVLLNTPITFPISWKKSKIDGVAIRISTPNIHGMQAYTTMGHTRSRFFGPSNGGLLFDSPLADETVFRIDHDQAFQQTTHLRYQRPNNGWWAAWTWRYDSGLVAGAVGSLDDALGLTGAQQAAIGFYCGGQQAAVGMPITACTGSNYGATRLRIPAEGTEDDDHNPPRISPRHLFDIGVGTDNLFHTEHVRTNLRFTVVNVANKVALYNFLSTFSGTHFVTPRTFQAQIGISF